MSSSPQGIKTAPSPAANSAPAVNSTNKLTIIDDLDNDANAASVSAATAASAREIRELQRKLRAVTTERDDLQKDVEALCLQIQPASSIFGSGFGGGHLMGGGGAGHGQKASERGQLSGAAAEVKELRAKLATAEAERDSLSEDVLELKDAKHSVDREAKAQAERIKQLEKEVAFLSAQSAKALSDRDQAGFEADSLRDANLAAELSLQKLRGKLEVEVASRAGSEKKVAALQREVERLGSELAAAAEAAAVVPAVKQQVVTAKEAGRKAEEAHAKTKALLEAAQTEVTRTELLLRQAHKIEDQLTGQLKQMTKAANEAAVREAQLKEQLSQAVTAAAAARQAHAEQTQGTSGSSPQQLNGLAHHVSTGGTEDSRHNGATSLGSVDTAMEGAAYAGSAKVMSDLDASDEAALPGGGLERCEDAPTLRAALAQVRAELRAQRAHTSEIQARVTQQGALGDDERERLDILSVMVKDLKVKLAQATQEKVEALLRMAAATQASASTPVAVPQRGGGAGSWFFGGHRGGGGGGEKEASAATQVAGSPSSTSPVTASRSAVHMLWSSSAASLPPLPPTPSTTSSPRHQHHASASAVLSAGGSQAPSSRSTTPATISDADHRQALTELSAAHTAEVAVLQAQISALQDRMAALEKLATSAHRFAEKLYSSAKVLWSRSETPAKRWAAITTLTSLHDECAALRIKLNLGPADDHLHTALTHSSAGLVSAKGSDGSGGGAVEARLAAQLLVLVDFGMQALDAFNRQSAELAAHH